MTKIDSPSAAIGHLYAFRDDKAALEQEVHRLQKAGELALDQAQLDEVCAFWKIPASFSSATMVRKRSCWAALT